MSIKHKRGHARSIDPQRLHTPDVMKLTITILVALLCLAAIGKPKVQADVGYKNNVQAIVSPAHAQSKPKTVAKPKTTPAPAKAAEAPQKPVFDANDPTTWPQCSENQVVWADDGQCHDKPVQAAPVATQSAPVRAVASGSPIGSCAGEDAMSGMDYVFCHESTKNPTATNSEGCVGLGQACPASKLYAACPDLDVDCQVAFFTNYAVSRYGSWSGAEAFWRGHHWW